MFGFGVSCVVISMENRQLLRRPCDGAQELGEEQSQEKCALEVSQRQSSSSPHVAITVMIKSHRSKIVKSLNDAGVHTMFHLFSCVPRISHHFVSPGSCVSLCGNQLTWVVRYNGAVLQPTEGRAAVAFGRCVSWQCSRRAARVRGNPAVKIGDRDADNPSRLAVVTSDDHFLATVEDPPGWFVVSISFVRLASARRTYWARLQVAVVAERVRRLVYRVLKNKIIDRFFLIAIAAASVGCFYTVVHPVKSLSWSVTIATRVWLLLLLSLCAEPRRT